MLRIHKDQLLDRTPAFCVNCGGDHPSFSKTCPTFLIEKEIQRVKTEKRIPFLEARKLVQGTQPQPGLSYSAVVKRKINMVSVACQTSEFVFAAPVRTPATSQVKTKASGGGIVSSRSRAAQRSFLAAGQGGKASGGGVVSASPQSPHRSTSSTGGREGKPTPSPKPTRGGQVAGPEGSRRVEVVEVPDQPALQKPPRPKSAHKEAGGPPSDRLKKAERQKMKTPVLSDDEDDVEMD